MSKEPYKKGRNICIFCGATASRKGEHFWPKWAKEHLPDSDRRIRRKFKGDQLHDTIEQTGSLKVTTMKTVCASCNNGWMSRIEEKVKPLLVVMMKGDEPLSIGPEQRLWLSIWVTLKALVADRSYPEDAVFSDEDCRSFAVNQLPFLLSSVTAYRFIGNPHTVSNFNRNQLKFRNSATGEIVQEALNFTFLFGQAFFQFWAQTPGPVPRPIGTSSISLWPIDYASIHWPPRKIIDVHKLNGIQFALNSISKRMVEIAPSRFRF